MATQPTQAIEVFYSYSHRDEKLRNELEKHLSILQRLGVITNWHDRKINAGEKWDGKLDEHLDTARIILLLISPDFMASDYCYENEVTHAMERHKAGAACVIPVFLRPVMWKGAPFGELQGLPTDLKPVTKWSNRDDAFVNISEGIRKAIEMLSVSTSPSLPPIPESPMPASLPAAVLRHMSSTFVTRRDREGRDLVEQLKAELAPGRNRLVTLWGGGGIGKTTLAARVAYELSEAFKHRIVWTSPELRVDFTLSALLDEIAGQLGRDDLRPLPLEPKEEAVRALVAAAPTLVILDNFEMIKASEQQPCANWLAQRAPCSSIIMTRQRIMGAHNFSIHAMTPAEASEFVKRWIALEAHSPYAFEGLERERIIEAAGRNPLVLQWVLARVDLAGEPGEVLDELMQGEGDTARRVFDSSFKLPQLGDDGRAVLLALSLFIPDASRKALAETAGFDASGKKRFNEAIMRLSSLWLVEATQGNKRLKIEGLTRQLTKSHFSKDARADEFRQRFVAHFLRYAQAHAKPTPEDFAALELEKDNILNAMDVAFGLNDWLTVIRLMSAMNLNGVNGLLTVHGYWDEAIRCGEQALKTAQNLRNEAAIAHFAHNTAITFQHRGELNEARQLYSESLEINKRLGDQNGIAITLAQLGVLAVEEGDRAEAVRLLREALSIFERLKSPYAEIARQILARLEGESS